MSDLPAPEYARNMRIVGYCDQGGRPDGVQVMVHRGFAYVGHMFSKGFSVIDVRDARNPRAVTFPHPTEADYKRKGGHFGPHNIHENRPGSFISDTLIFATYQNAGVRVFDIADANSPREARAWVPPAPARMMDTRPNRAQVIQSADVFVDAAGLIYVTDYNAGLYVMEFVG